MSLNDTPRGDRLHIGLFGKRNSGKSSLINALTGQNIAIVSDTPGTTADPVFKSMELHPVGPVVFIDTAGFDDEGELGALRVKRTKDVADRTDIGIIVIDGQACLDVMTGSCLQGKTAESEAECREGNSSKYDTVRQAGGIDEIGNRDFLLREYLTEEKDWASELASRNIPVIIAVNKCENMAESQLEYVQGEIAELMDAEETAAVSAKSLYGIEQLRDFIEKAVPEDLLRRRILGDIADEGSLVLLVMPQDIQAPKGRLILPQVQTIRELLDRRCTTVCTTADGLKRTLDALGRAPDLIITDSQCFRMVYDMKPESSRLTSFSVLFAAYKGDIKAFLAGASAIDNMTEKSRVLIAEACTHVPLSEDIGREKIPALLRKKFGDGIEIVNVCGNDFPDVDELGRFDLVIHCGACMFNRRHVLSRIAQAKAAGVPITNYGIVLAKLTGILDKIQI